MRRRALAIASLMWLVLLLSTGSATSSPGVFPHPAWPSTRNPSEPAPQGSAHFLNAVASISSTDAWAVGTYYPKGSRRSYALAKHWDGTGWSRAATPSVGRNDFLFGVSSTSATDVWAVGMYDDWSTGTTDTLTLHYDGSAWSIVASPSFGPSSQLGDVFAVSPSDVWAVGCNQIDPNGDTATLILHYDGSSWTQVASPSPTADPCLSGVWAASPTDVWAVGSYLNGQSDATLIEHWDGSSWSIVSSPNSSDSLLYSVSGTSSSDVWAVGQGQGWADTTLVEHWDGSSWSIVTSPSVRHVNDQLFSVIALSPTNAWAVGSTFCAVVICKVGEETLIEHWDGSAWSIVPSPTPGTFPMGGLAGVSATGPDDLWAVGDFVHIHTQNIGVMIEHWSGAKWVLVEP